MVSKCFQEVAQVTSLHFGAHDKFKGTKSTRLNTWVVTFDPYIYKHTHTYIYILCMSLDSFWGNRSS